MTYKRVMRGSGFDYISVLDEAGNLTTAAVWPDGFSNCRTTINIFDVGWNSLKEFLRERPGFKPFG